MHRLLVDTIWDNLMRQYFTFRKFLILLLSTLLSYNAKPVVPYLPVSVIASILKKSHFICDGLQYFWKYLLHVHICTKATYFVAFACYYLTASCSSDLIVSCFELLRCENRAALVYWLAHSYNLPLRGLVVQSLFDVRWQPHLILVVLSVRTHNSLLFNYELSTTVHYQKTAGNQ